jgi:molybdopterin synthase sulfur carrier subunit
MSISISIPTPLRALTGQKDTVEVDSKNVHEMLNDLEKAFPGIYERLVDDQGEVRRFVNIYVGGEDIRFLQNQQTPLKAGDEVSIVPAIAGG